MKILNRAFATHLFLILIIVCIGLVSIPCPAFTQTAKERKAGIGPHPRLYFTKTNLDVLRRGLRQDSQLATDWNGLREQAENLVSGNDARARDLELLGFAFLMTGDVRFAEVVKRILLHEIARDRWEGQMLLNRTPPWNAGLDLARNIFYTAVGFDCIYETLTDSERRTIAEGIARLGVRPVLNDWILGPDRIHSFDSMGHNWWSSCVYMAGIGALAILDEVDEAHHWVEVISETALQWFLYRGNILDNSPANYDHGGFYESVNYAAYALGQYLFFRLAWNNSFPGGMAAAIPDMESMGDFFVHMAYPNRGPLQSVNFGDSNRNATGQRPIRLLMANGIQKKSFDWYLDQLEPGQFWEGLENDRPLGLLLAAVAPHTSSSHPDLPHAALYPRMGWASLRNSWEIDASMLAVKSGFTWNHAHADAGSFILYHDGEYMLIDPGNCGYSRPEYTQYYCQSIAHNVVLFNGEGQIPEDDYYGVKNPGSLHYLMDSGEFKYILADATGPYAHNLSRNYRNFLWIGNVILVIDDLKSHVAGQFEWLLHYNYDGQAIRRGQDIHVSMNDARIRVRPLFPETFPDGGVVHDFPEKMHLRERTGLKDRDPDTEVPYFSVYHPEISRRTKFITAIILEDKHQPDNLPQLERLESKNMIGVRIRQDEYATDVFFNLMADGRIMHRPAHNEFYGWKTDAYLLSVTYPEDATGDPEETTRLFIANGSYLRTSNQVYLNSLSKGYVLVENKRAHWDMIMEGQPVMDVELRALKNPSAVILNGKKIQHTWSRSNNSLRIKKVNW